MKSKLSIVMPTYGHLKYTKEALINLRQVVPHNTEIIVIDDGSTDGTVEFLKQQKDIKFIDNKVNRGVTYSRNLGVSIAKGEYICVINNDVIFPQGFFEKLMAGFGENIIATVPRRTNGRDKDNKLIKYYQNHVCGFVYMFKQSQKNWIFPLEPRLRIFGSDNRMYHRIKEEGLKICTVKDAVCHHRESITSLSEENCDTEMFKNICKEEGRNIVDTVIIDTEPEGNVLI